MERLYSGKGSGNAALYKDAVGQLQLPMQKKRGAAVDQLVDAMADLIPDSPDRPDNLHDS